MANRPKAPTSMIPNVQSEVLPESGTEEVKPVAATPTSNGEARESTVDEGIQLHLGQKLKDTYEDLIKQPVPDKFRQLLEDLERQEKKR